MAKHHKERDPMNSPLTILLVEDDPSEIASFKQHIEAAEGVRLVATTDNTDNALELIKNYLPNIIILELELHNGVGNGISLLAALEGLDIPVTPYILVITRNTSRKTHDMARKHGADFIFIKSEKAYSVKNVLDFLLKTKDITLKPQSDKHKLASETLPPANLHNWSTVMLSMPWLPLLSTTCS
jgi:DNA-binding NarL/FixJ family response regulator